MKKLIIVLLIVCAACRKQEKANLIVVNVSVYTVDDSFATAEAFAVKDGKIIAVGSTEEIKNNYATLKTVDTEGKAVYLGFIDAHCHFLGLGLAEQKVNLRGTKSYEEVLEKLVAFQKEKNLNYITRM